jgi:hypothetical protein
MTFPDETLSEIYPQFRADLIKGYQKPDTMSLAVTIRFVEEI